MSDSNAPRLREQIAEIARLCWERGYIGAIDGNISVRQPDGTILITPAGVVKFLIRPEQVVHCDASGKPMDGGRASTETAMHVACYQERKDVNAVVHAHPPTAVAFSLAGIGLMDAVIPELVVTLGAIPTAPYGTPGTHELPDSIREYVKCSDAVLMERHGALTLGKDLIDAYKKMEQIEHNAKITYMARTLGQVKNLSPEEVKKLLGTRETLGIETTNVYCNHCGQPVPVKKG